MRTTVFLAVLCFAGWYVAEGKLTDREETLELTKEERDRIVKLWAKYGPDYSLYDQVEDDYPCGPLPRSPSVPTSVHELRPGDIKVIGAMGDSLTAGTGIEASNILMVLTQNRGMSWSGGGETTFEDQITLPNILKKYNPDVYGFATGDGDEDSARSMFNVAVSGSTSSDLVNQAQEIILRMKNDPSVDIDNDWKIVTILSGNNDLCDYCKQRDNINQAAYYEHMTSALDILHAQLPRTLVNLVEPLNMEIVTELNKGFLCSTLHFLVCECAAFPDDEEAKLELIQEADLFQNTVEQIALSGRYDTRPDFTVVSQPFFNATYLPRTSDGQPDLTYFSPDCFHLSRKGQAAAAGALWNNMIQPVRGKSTQWTPGETIQCPTEAQPFFYTNQNSERSQHTRSVFQEMPDNEGEDDKEMVPLSPGHKSPSASTHVTTVAAVTGVGVAVVVVAVVVALVLKRKRLQRHSYETI